MDTNCRDSSSDACGDGRTDAVFAMESPEAPRPLAQLTFDADLGVLVSASAEGLAMLGLPAGLKLPLAMDAAMPAMRRLRDIQSGLPALETEHLTFWYAGRLVRIAGKISREQMANGRSRLVVRALHEKAPAKATVQSDPDPHAPVACEDGDPVTEFAGSDSRPERDDKEILREIARRIRAGQRPNDLGSATHEPDEQNASQRLDTPAVKPQNEMTATSRRSLPGPDERVLSKVAHELKTPLSAIVAAAEIMRDEQLGPMGNSKYLGYAGDIYESARHALDVINAMLTTSQRNERQVAQVDLNEITRATASAMQALARSAGLVLAADCDERPLEVRGEATAIRQIIYNLVSNALKFTPQGGEVRVLTGHLPTGLPFLVVRDTGEGMDESAIVEAFYRDESALDSRKGGGYGIGLPLVRRLAEFMGATIDVDSAPGKGTVVLVSFPNG